jgi:hypothetical protein
MLYRYYILYTLYRYRLESYTEGYGVDINISVCYTDTSTCEYHLSVLTDTIINASICDLAADFLDTGLFISKIINCWQQKIISEGLFSVWHFDKNMDQYRNYKA